MPVERIEKVVAGVVVQQAERNSETGLYQCHAKGSNIDPQPFATLDEVASYLRANPKSGVRMNPGWAKISEDVFIDGAPR